MSNVLLIDYDFVETTMMSMVSIYHIDYNDYVWRNLDYHNFCPDSTSRRFAYEMVCYYEVTWLCLGLFLQKEE